MTVIREILIDWTTPAGGGFRSVTHWSTVTAVASQRATLESFTDALAAALDNNVSCVIETAGREFEDTTGVLTGSWTDPTVRTSTGSVAGEPVADATQVLIRWESNSIVNGRFIVGRTFIPGMAAAQLVGGNASAILVANWTGFAQALVTAGTGFRVWHRPQGGTGGVAVSPQVGRALPELAVLRRRRR
jgi:hypothetical protein